MGWWDGWFPNRPKSHPPFVFPNLTKTLRWVGGFTHLGKLLKKGVFWRPSLSLEKHSTEYMLWHATPWYIKGRTPESTDFAFILQEQQAFKPPYINNLCVHIHKWHRQFIFCQKCFEAIGEYIGSLEVYLGWSEFFCVSSFWCLIWENKSWLSVFLIFLF